MHLHLAHVSKRFGRAEALSSVTVTFSPGRIYAVTGENGAGKSTLLRLVAGVLMPDEGDVMMDEVAFSRKNLDLRRRVYFTPDTPVLFDDETVVRNVVTIAKLYQKDIDPAMPELAAFMDECGIAEAALKRVNQLSRGEAWKAGMAVVRAVQPEVWLVDEPFASGMDAIGQAVFKKLVRQLTAAGSTVMYTTQLLDLAASFSDEVLVLRRGKLSLQTSGSELAKALATSEDAGARILKGETLLQDS